MVDFMNNDHFRLVLKHRQSLLFSGVPVESVNIFVFFAQTVCSERVMASLVSLYHKRTCKVSRLDCSMGAVSESTVYN